MDQLHLVAFLMDQHLRNENERLELQVQFLSDQLCDRNRVIAQLQSDFDVMWNMYQEIERERDRLAAEPPAEEDPLETAFRLGEESVSETDSEDFFEMLLRTD